MLPLRENGEERKRKQASGGKGGKMNRKGMEERKGKVTENWRKRLSGVKEGK